MAVESADICQCVGQPKRFLCLVPVHGNTSTHDNTFFAMGRYGLELERIAAKLEMLESKKHKVRKQLADICAESAVLTLRESRQVHCTQRP